MTEKRPLPGINVTIDAKAVRVSSRDALTVLSSAPVGGGFGAAREILNLHVDDGYDGGPEDDLAAAAARLGIERPFVGMMTAAPTELAQCSAAVRGLLTVAAVISLGLSNPSLAGVTPPFDADTDAQASQPAPGTINVILLVDGALSPAAMVNAVITATEAKTATLLEWDVKTPGGDVASGTSTDTVVVACTGRGPELHYAGPATPVGWLIARAVRDAMARVHDAKIERDGGRVGW